MKNNQTLTKKLKLIVAAIITVILLASVANMVRKVMVDPEKLAVQTLLATRKAMNESGDDIDFHAFFLRDLDGDGYTEDMSEIDQTLDNTDYMFVELNIKNERQLKNGKIKIESSNFKWKTAIISNNIIKNDYIGYTNEIELQDLTNGTQVLLYGKIDSKIGNNIHDYSKNSLVTLTGIDENDQDVRIESNLKVNWSGLASTTVGSSYSQVYNINNAITDDGFKADFSVRVAETKGQLLMQKQETQMVIPELNGYKPTSVECTSGNVEQSYDEDTRILSLSREAAVDEDGNITKSVSRDATYQVRVMYPMEAYDTLGSNSVLLNVEVTGKNYCYNSEKVGITESTATRTVSAVYKEIPVVVPVVRESDTWNLYTTVGTYAKKDTSYGYRISKENIQNLYNGNVYEDVTDSYQVVWQASIGQKDKINSITLESNGIDKFNNSTSMEDYMSTTGIYFSNASNVLGDDGRIELYNREGGLLEIFTKDNWGTYTSTNPYRLNAKEIKVVTTKPVSNTYFYVYQIKELDDEKIVEDYTQEQFNNLTSINTYAKGTIEVVEGETSNTATTQTKSASAIFDTPVSLVSFSSSPSQIANQKSQDVTLTISTSSSNAYEKKWKDGTFLVELPEEIINAEVSNVTVSNNKVNIKSTVLYKENNKYFVRIDTENEEPQTYSITLNLAISANPLYSTRTSTIKLYASNKNCENYNGTAADTYDIDSDGTTQDRVAYRTRNIELLAAQGLITEEYITDYDDNGSMTISPNIAEIDRSDEARTAKINVSIANNYPETITELVILGKVPYEGNTYVLNSNINLNSQYTAHMKGAITVPQELAEYATVYYSENETPSKDLTDASNGWTQTVNDWTKVKSYLIDLGEFVLTNTGNKVFSYEVEVPAKTGYNKATFATHAVYYSLVTEVGKRRTETQPGKVGLQVVGKYKFELTKNKVGQSNVVVPGATYKFVTKDANGADAIRTATTNANGKLVLNGLYIEREHTLSELSTPSDYELNSNEIIFNTAVEDVNGVQELRVNTTSGNFSGIPTVSIDSNNNYLAKANVEDEAKYTLVINTQDEESHTLTDVRYAILGKDQGRMYKDVNDQVKATGLYLNEEYQLQLMKSVGYYTDETPRTFKIVRDETTNKLKIVTEDEELQNAIIVEEIAGQSTVTLTIQTERIPTYDLQIVKIEEPANEGAELTYLTGAQFKLTSEDLYETEVYTVDQTEGITVNGLYNYVQNKNTISGRYTLQEIKAPDGYSNNAEEIEFYVEKTDEGSSVNITNESGLRTLYSAEIEENTLKLIIQDKPMFKLTKVDSEQTDELGNPLLLPNAKFVIMELDSNRNQIDFAKDVNGNYVGEYDEETEQYIVTTDENGEIKIPLRAGDYMIKEVGYPEGYFEESNVQVFQIRGKTELNEIYYIEDLVELSNLVNAGESFDKKTIKLMRTLDFNDTNSYKSIANKEKLTTNGGFVPIGDSSMKCFRGVFDGQGHEIKNIYINSNNTEYVGLFGYIEDAEIKNLGITGVINGNNNSNYLYIGGIAGYQSHSVITNCYNKAEVRGVNNNGYVYTGGIAGCSSWFCTIRNVYNTAKISGNSNSTTYVGGIIGYAAEKISLNNGYNIGDISSSGKTIRAGKIFGDTGNDSTEINNCYFLNTAEGASNYGGIEKTEQEMKDASFLKLLGDSYYETDDENINNGFPVLSYYEGIKENEGIIEINYIEDLVDLSKTVNSGVPYIGKRIKLMRNLDFNNEESYKNSTDESYGDINGDGITDSLITELTTGFGFTPIGNELGYAFRGIFDGQGNEIRNLYIDRKASKVGLFGSIDNAEITNLGITGNINSSNYSGVYAGGIVGWAYDSKINNCYNKANISGYSSYSSAYYSVELGGIAGLFQR